MTRHDRLRAPFAGQHPATRHVPGAGDRVVQGAAAKPLVDALVLHDDVLRARAELALHPLRVETIPATGAFHEHGLEEDVLGDDRPSTQAVGKLRAVGDVCRGEARPDLRFIQVQRLHRTQRRADEPGGEGLVAARDLLGARVVAVMLEDANVVFDRALEEVSVHHAAKVPARCEVGASQRARDEVVARLAVELIPAERHLEPATANLQAIGELDLAEQVAPLGLRALGPVDGRVYGRGQLTLDAELEHLEQLAVDADARARELQVVEVLRVVARKHLVALELHAEIEAQPLARPQRRVVLPDKAQPLRLPVVGLGRRGCGCGCRGRYGHRRRGGRRRRRGDGRCGRSRCGCR